MQAVSTEATGSVLDAFRDQKTVILTSYRRDGTPVDTPVHVAVVGDRAYIRTDATAFKTKRLRRNPEMELWLASNGAEPALKALSKPREAKRAGFGVRGRVRLLGGDESRRAADALARKYPVLHGFLIPWSHRFLYRTETVHFELTPEGEATPRPGRPEPGAP
jgi:uncharacterized protein